MLSKLKLLRRIVLKLQIFLEEAKLTGILTFKSDIGLASVIFDMLNNICNDNQKIRIVYFYILILNVIYCTKDKIDHYLKKYPKMHLETF